MRCRLWKRCGASPEGTDTVPGTDQGSVSPENKVVAPPGTVTCVYQALANKGPAIGDLTNVTYSTDANGNTTAVSIFVGGDGLSSQDATKLTNDFNAPAGNCTGAAGITLTGGNCSGYPHGGGFQ